MLIICYNHANFFAMYQCTEQFMKLKTLFCTLLLASSQPLFAQWQDVGRADYTWGPFLVYTVSLATENGEFKDGQRPVMISFDYAKPVEGKNFAIIMTKEMESLGVDHQQALNWLSQLELTLSEDFSPNDRLTFIALENSSYFMLNDQILPHVYGPEFTQAFIELWLANKGTFSPLFRSLVGEAPTSDTPIVPKPVAVEPLSKEEATPELPPNYPIFNLQKTVG